jgi:hypothetical protein
MVELGGTRPTDGEPPGGEGAVLVDGVLAHILALNLARAAG